MATYTYTNTFSVAGVGVNGVSISAYKASRFSSPPALSASAPGGGADATATTGTTFGSNGAFAIALPTAEDYYILAVYSASNYWLGPVSQVYADGTAQGGTAAAATLPPYRSGFDLTGTLDSPSLATTTNTASVIQTQAWQNVPRRGGNLGAATVAEASSSFPYGQVEVILGDSIAQGTGASTFGVNDWASVLGNYSNRLNGLPDVALGFVPANNPDGLYGTPKFAAVGASLTAVTGIGGGVATSPNDFLTAVQLTGAVGSLVAASTLSDTRVFSRAIIWYKPQTNSDGIGVCLTGTTAGASNAVTATIDASISNGTGAFGNSTVAGYDTGNISSPSVAPTIALTRATHVTGSGGTAPIVYGITYYTAGVAGTKGLTMLNLAAGGTTSQSWLTQRGWESLLGALGGTIRRVHIRLGGNDIYKARTFADATLSNSSPTIGSTATAQFLPGDVGRPITGTNIPANTTITAVASATSATMSNNATGSASGTYTLGQVPIATTISNLTTILTRIRAQVPLAEIALFSEYHVWSSALSAAAWMPIDTYATTVVPQIQQLAFNNNCTYVNAFDRIGSVSQIVLTDAGITNGQPTLTSTSIGHFSSYDIGAKVTGTNIPANTTIISVQSPTSCTMSNNATGSTSGNYTVNHDVYGLTIALDHLHLGDYTNSTGGLDGQRAHAEQVIERLGYTDYLPQPVIAGSPVTLTSGTNWLVPGTGTQTWSVTLVGGGGQGGGGASAGNVTNLAVNGGGGGGSGATVQQNVTLTGGTLIPYTIGAGGTGSGAGGAAGAAHAGNTGANGGNTTWNSSAIVANGGGGGLGGTITAANSVAGGAYGNPSTSSTGPANTFMQGAGIGGAAGFWNATGNGAVGGGALGYAGGAGGGGGAASASGANGGTGGGGGTLAAGGTAGAIGGAGTGQGADGGTGNLVNGAGAGGGGGGGGNNNLRGGNGGVGIQGAIVLQRLA